MIVNLRIDRLVLDGLPVGTHQGPAVEAAVQAELTRLLTEGHGLPHATDRAVPFVRSSAIAAPAVRADTLGGQIGQAVFESIRS